MKRHLHIVFWAGLLAFSFWLMHHTLSYDSNSTSILVSGKYYSDFGNTLPLIRSFSKGLNFPPEYPGFPGEPIRYHFLFFAASGLFEKAGLRLDHALNVPSALGFFALLVMLFALSKKIIHRTSVAFLSVVLFLFNGSLSWLDYFKSHSYSLGLALSNLPKLSEFPAFSPWNQSDIAAFWNLNIYTNQRHLGLSFSVSLVVVYLLKSRTRIYLIGIFLGMLLLLNQAAFAAASLVTSWFFLVDRSLRIKLLQSSIGSIPFVLFSYFFTQTSFHPIFHPGFLMTQPLTILNLFVYWFRNIGLHLLLIPLGVALAPVQAKRFAIPLLLLFILPNIWQFSPDIVNNHKFFNFFLLLGVIFTANALIRLKPLMLLLPLLIAGGVVDFFPILNDRYYNLTDHPANPDVRYFVDLTSPQSVVLNSTWFYHPASLAGRKIFNGYSYFTWSYGYDQLTREKVTSQIFASASKSSACTLLRQNSIDYVELNPRHEGFIFPNNSLWQKDFVPSYTNPATKLTVYSTDQNCP